MTPTITAAWVLKALRVVFGDDSPEAADIAMLSAMSRRDLAARFRSRALEMHPDRAGTLGLPQETLEREFKHLHGAYRVLSRLLDDAGLRARILESAAASHARTRERTEPGGLWAPGTADGPSRGEQEATMRADRGPAPGEGMYHTGRIPQSELRFAQFLYYSRVIDWRTMIDAITWQYRVRPKIGEIGRAFRFLDFDSVTRVLRTSPRGELFGDTAMRLRLLDRRQLHVVLGKQHRLNYPIGRYFLEQGILSRFEIGHLLQQNRLHNLKYRRKPNFG